MIVKVIKYKVNYDTYDIVEFFLKSESTKIPSLFGSWIHDQRYHIYSLKMFVLFASRNTTFCWGLVRQERALCSRLAAKYHIQVWSLADLLPFPASYPETLFSKQTLVRNLVVATTLFWHSCLQYLLNNVHSLVTLPPLTRQTPVYLDGQYY